MGATRGHVELALAQGAAEAVEHPHSPGVSLVMSSRSAEGAGSRGLDDGVAEDAAVNDYVQARAKVPHAAALQCLRECLSDKKLGSRVKHALKDLVLYRLRQSAAGVLLLQLLVQVSHDEKALGKEERKIGR